MKKSYINGALSNDEIIALLDGTYMGMEVCMGDQKTIVVTAYGHDKIIDKIAVSLFERNSWSYDQESQDAKKYCTTINSLELKENF